AQYNQKKKMKILNITKYFYPKYGGIETRNFEISKYLSQNGFEIHVSTSKHAQNLDDFEVYGGINIRRHKILFKAFNDVFYPGIIKDIFRLDFDLVHVDLPDPVNSIFAFFASVIKNKPLIITHHADIEKEELEKFPASLILKAYNIILKFILQRAKKIFVTSKDYAKSGKNPGNFKFEDESEGGKLVLSPNFIDENKSNIENYDEIEKIRKNLDLENKKIILFVGRLVQYKGVEYLLKSFKEVEKNFNDVVLLIIGDGPLRKNLENLTFGSNNIKFLGKVENLNPYYALCDIFVLPSISRQEAFGLVLIEAMYFGKPCITTNIESGMKYVVDYGDAGILVKEKNTEELKNAIENLIVNENLRKEIGKKARKRVLENFTSMVVLEKFEREINKLIPKT
ncbi:MAG: glycosyltransferase, partial [Candidatus Altarchaeum sp.]|nr:glycosyltransferase [Candidatus Altarchaeum sp.]